MISFKQFLLEKALNKSVYAETMNRLGDSAMIGIEIEARVPPESAAFVTGTPTEPATLELSAFDTLTKFSKYFNIPGDVERGIQDDYNGWVTAHEDEYVEANWTDFVEDEEVRDAEKLARRAAARSYKGEHKLSDWLAAEFKDVRTFVDEYFLEPKFGWSGDAVKTEPPAEVVQNEHWAPTAKSIAAALGKVLKTKVVVKSEPGPGYEHWKIVPDTSITNGNAAQGQTDDDLDGVGIEIVSPPLPASEAIAILKVLFDFMTEHELETNSSTAIHVNISVPELATRLDPLKMVMFMGDEHILKTFNRTGNLFSSPQIKHIIDGIQITGQVPSTGEELLAAASRSLSMAKYRSVNLSHLEDGYLEFRSAGGTDYHQKYELIVDTIGRWLTAVDIACDPALERQEYLKKVSKLLGRTYGETEKDLYAEYSIEQLVKATSGKYNGAEVWHQIETQTDAAAFYKMAVNFEQRLSYSPNLKQIGELRRRLRSAGVTVADIQAAGPEPIAKFAALFKIN